MNTPNDRRDTSKYAERSVSSSLHQWVYAALIALALWFVLWIWSFAGAGVTDYLLSIVSGFILVVAVLTFILSRVGHNYPAVGPDKAKADKQSESFRDWATSHFDTDAGRLRGFQAATQILLPIGAAAFGMTAFGIIFMIVEHSSM